MNKNLAMAMIAASLVALSALATLSLVGGAAATVRGVRTIEIPLGSYAHAAGTDLYCEFADSSTGVPGFNCFASRQAGSNVHVGGNSYAVLIAAAGVVVDKSNASATKWVFTKTYANG
jgi:hypothetical protein